MEQAAHDIIAIADPASRGAQKLSQVLILLQQVMNANIRVFFNSAQGQKELPLKTYYRYVKAYPEYFKSNSLSRIAIESGFKHLLRTSSTSLRVALDLRMLTFVSDLWLTVSLNSDHPAS